MAEALGCGFVRRTGFTAALLVTPTPLVMAGFAGPVTCAVLVGPLNEAKAGTCSPCSNVSPGSPAVPSSASGCPRRSATRKSSCTGCKAPARTPGPARSSRPIWLPFAPPKRPTPDERAIRGLKFSAALPGEVARRVLATRLQDGPGARAVLTEPVHWLRVRQ